MTHSNPLGRAKIRRHRRAVSRHRCAIVDRATGAPLPPGQAGRAGRARAAGDAGLLEPPRRDGPGAQATAGCTPATSPRWTRRAISPSSTAPRTSSSPAGSTSTRAKSRRSCSRIPPCARPPSRRPRRLPRRDGQGLVVLKPGAHADGEGTHRLTAAHAWRRSRRPAGRVPRGHCPSRRSAKCCGASSRPTTRRRPSDARRPWRVRINR